MPRLERGHRLPDGRQADPGRLPDRRRRHARSASASKCGGDSRDAPPHTDARVPRLKAALRRRDPRPSSRSRSASATSWRSRASRRSSSTWASAAPPSRPSLLEGAVARPRRIITGQKPLVTRAKKSIAGFKLREGNAIGAKVTLRGDRMWEFLDRLISLAIPRIRDFRGLPPNGRSTAAATTPSASPSSSSSRRSTTTRSTRPGAWTSPSSPPPVPTPRARRCSTPSASRSEREGQQYMAKKALIEKQQRKPEVQGAGLHPLPALRPAARRCTASSGCAASACASWCTPARSPV